MTRIQWQSAFETGIPEVDNQHRKFVGFINRLEDLAGAGEAADPSVLRSVMADLVNYANYHFAFEQNMQQEIGFSDSQAHLARHMEILDWLKERLVDPSPQSELGLVELLSCLMDWFLRHVLVEDMRFGREYARMLQGSDSGTVVV